MPDWMCVCVYMSVSQSVCVRVGGIVWMRVADEARQSARDGVTPGSHKTFMIKHKSHVLAAPPCCAHHAGWDAVIEGRGVDGGAPGTGGCSKVGLHLDDGLVVGGCE